MLVLTRRINESIMIGDDIVITILAVDGDKAKLGIDAPRDVAILREELYSAVQEQNLAAIRFGGGSSPESIEKLREILSEMEKPEG
ncbi:MAG: carbon storage regulator CsrA [Anaerolineales bacterium]|nr:carbon storage regulator CsrA [Anaerolineales bacterium]